MCVQHYVLTRLPYVKFSVYINLSQQPANSTSGHVRPAKIQISLHIRIVRAFTVRTHNLWIFGNLCSEQWRLLIWVVAGRTCPKVFFADPQPISLYSCTTVLWLLMWILWNNLCGNNVVNYRQLKCWDENNNNQGWNSYYRILSFKKQIKKYNVYNV